MMFLDPLEYPFVSMLERNASSILSDLRRLDPSRYVPWVDHAGYSGDWSGYGLFHHRQGWVLHEHCNDAGQGCAVTRRILTRIPGLLVAGFSRMAPACHVHAHVDARRARDPVQVEGDSSTAKEAGSS